MEQNVQVMINKRIWSIARAIFFMLRKGFSKKLILDLNLVLKRGKIATKALTKLLLHHHHHNLSSSAREYEFSCSNTPAYTFPTFNLNKKNKHNMTHTFFGFTCLHAPPTLEDDATTLNAVKAAMEMMINNNDKAVEASPALPGFGRSPFVRPLRVTDSPFPLRDIDEDNGLVDKAAEEFIQKFYRELKKQKING